MALHIQFFSYSFRPERGWGWKSSFKLEAWVERSNLGSTKSSQARFPSFKYTKVRKNLDVNRDDRRLDEPERWTIGEGIM